ncbi:MAG TPA: outer membrane beta-barrel protein [Gemmatimonadaceae bacterium]|nr:outer membrane beta-barrel protein [Gemmatimonadaceae bacterium]
MNRRFVLAGVLTLLAVAGGSADAQRRGGRRMPVIDETPTPSVSPYAGYMMFGDIADGPLGTRLTSSSGSVFGVQANLPLGSTLSVVGNVAYSEPDLRFGVPILGGINFGKSQVWLYDAGLQLSAPVRRGERTIVPFVQAGAGGMKYDVQVAGISRSASNVAFNAGLGVDVPLVQNLGLRLFAKDYIGKFDVNEAAGIDYDAKTSHNIALSAGLKLQF